MKKVPELSDRLEQLMNRGRFMRLENIVNTAVELRNVVLTEQTVIGHREKIRMLKLLSKAKVHTMYASHPERKRMLGTLNSVGDDLLRSF